MTEKNDNVYLHSYETYNNEGMHKTYVTGRCLFHFIDILQVFEINLVKTFIRLSCHSRLIKTVKLIRLIIKCFKKKRLPSFNKFYFDLPTGPSFQYLLLMLVQHYITVRNNGNYTILPGLHTTRICLILANIYTQPRKSPQLFLIVNFKGNYCKKRKDAFALQKSVYSYLNAY